MKNVRANSFKQICRPIAFLGLASIFLVQGSTQEVLAQSAFCYELESRLASLDNSRNQPTRQSQKLAAASKDVRARINAVARKARRAKCRTTGIRLFQNRKCSGFSREINKLKRTLNSIEAQRNRGRSTPRRERQLRNDLLQQLGRNNCGPQYAKYAKRNSYTIFGRNRDQDRLPRVSTYRTLCVRECDGYYFPVSFSTTQRAFARDEAICKSAFPNTEMSLYFHPRGFQNPMQSARSIDGQLYASKPEAFKYRTNYDSACAFHGAADSYKVTENGLPQAQWTSQNALVLKFGMNGPLPAKRPTLGLDPEAAMNFAGSFTPSAQQVPAAVTGTALIKDGEVIKTVGPQFSYGQSMAIASPSQAPSAIQ